MLSPERQDGGLGLALGTAEFMEEVHSASASAWGHFGGRVGLGCAAAARLMPMGTAD